MNTRTSTIRRAACAVGAAATLGLTLATPAGARPEPGEPVPSVVPSAPGPVVIQVDDNALELLQVGGGLIAGLALAGAGAALVSRRRHAATHFA